MGGGVQLCSDHWRLTDYAQGLHANQKKNAICD